MTRKLIVVKKEGKTKEGKTNETPKNSFENQEPLLHSPIARFVSARIVAKRMNGVAEEPFCPPAHHIAESVSTKQMMEFIAEHKEDLERYIAQHGYGPGLLKALLYEIKEAQAIVTILDCVKDTILFCPPLNRLQLTQILEYNKLFSPFSKAAEELSANQNPVSRYLPYIIEYIHGDLGRETYFELLEKTGFKKSEVIG